MVTKVTYVGEDFTRKPPKFERFIRPMVCDSFGDYITFFKQNYTTFALKWLFTKMAFH